MRSCLTLGAVLVCTFSAFTQRLGAAIIDLPEITATSFGHGYSKATPTNLLAGIADGVSFRGTQGTYTTTPFNGQFQTGDILRQHIVAPAGYKFSLFADPQLGVESFGAQVSWSTGASDVVDSTQTVSVSYDNPVGLAPTEVYSTVAGVSNSGEVATWDFFSPVANNFTFTGLTLQFTLATSTFGGSHTFTLTSQSDPSFYANGVGFQASDATLLGLVPIPVPEPAAIAAAALWTLGALRRRR